MLIRRRSHSIPALNTTSTADISFMLLIFFLITSSLDVDKGLARQLPPLDKEEVQEEAAIDKQQLLTLRIEADGTLLANGQLVAVRQLRGRVIDFVRRQGRNHLISVSADPQANYQTYFQMQNELMAAYRQLRDELALRKYGVRMEQCDEPAQTAIRQAVPQRIAEVYEAAEEGGRP